MSDESPSPPAQEFVPPEGLDDTGPVDERTLRLEDRAKRGAIDWDSFIGLCNKFGLEEAEVKYERIVAQYGKAFVENEKQIVALEQRIAQRGSPDTPPEKQTNQQLELMVRDMQAETDDLDRQVNELREEIERLEAANRQRQEARAASRRASRPSTPRNSRRRD
jgi:uncharacterized small protein (DUF1192 family)